MSQAEADKQNDDHRIQDGESMKEVDLENPRQCEGKTKVEVREKKGILRRAIPQVSTSVAWAVLFTNLFIPGSGTIILSFVALCGGKTELKTANRCLAFLINFGTALLQTITAVIIVGWIWGINWGMHAVTEATARSEELKKQKRYDEAKEAEEMMRLKARDDKNAQSGENEQTDKREQ